MRKLKLQVHMSIDGYIAGPNGEIDWIFTGTSQQPVIDLASDCDTVLLGRKMSQEYINHWQSLHETQPDNELARILANQRQIVFSRSQTTISGKNAEITNEDLVTKVNALKQGPGQNIIVYGGAEFVSSLIENNLIDEYNFFIKPSALGGGLSIFKGRKKFVLTKSVQFGDTTVLNTYVPA